MHNVDPHHLTELRVLLNALGTSGGLISPSVYDTAHVLRLAPHRPGADYTWTWLLAQQQSDGGWGNRAVPCARDLPTLAAMAALAKHPQCSEGYSAIQAGLTFLRSQYIHWSDPLPDDIPVGIELLLPHLLADAARLGLDVPQAQYAPLVVLGDQRRRLIAHVSPGAGSAASYSWEAWGTDPNPALIDGSGGVGHSPAATAAWLAASIQQNTMDAPKSAAGYLAQAAAATVQNQPGLMPTVWPINRFEQVWVLYTLFVAGLLDHPALDDLVWPHLCDLRSALGPNGIGMSDYFVYDGDITATTLAILHATGHDVDWSILHAFQEGEHYRTYTGELQPSLTTTAHAMLALALSGADVTHCVRFLIGKQQPDGRWIGDKWHSSWLYTTAQVLTALAQAGQRFQPLSKRCCASSTQMGVGAWVQQRHLQRQRMPHSLSPRFAHYRFLILLSSMPCSELFPGCRMRLQAHQSTQLRTGSAKSCTAHTASIRHVSWVRCSHWHLLRSAWRMLYSRISVL
jgi:hypothetical protein